MIPVLQVSGKGIADTWEKSVDMLWKNGIRIKTEYDKPKEPLSIDATMVMVASEPLSEPRIHLSIPSTFKDLEKYEREVVDGVHDHWIDPKSGKWTYTYHQRLFKYPSPEGHVNQIDYIVNKLSDAPYTRRAQAITWNPRLDPHTDDPPCLPPDSLIYVYNGPKAISNVTQEDIVLTHCGNFRKVTKVYRRHFSGNLIEITAKFFGKIQLTPEHPVLVLKGLKCPWTRGKILCKPTCRSRLHYLEKNGHDCPRAYGRYEPMWAPAASIGIGDLLLFPIPKLELKSPKIEYFTINQDTLYLIGLFLSEGDLSKEDAIRFSLSKREEHLINRISEIMENACKLEPHISEVSDKECVRISFYNRGLTRFFKENFYNSFYEGLDKQLPSWALYLSRHLQKNLLLGLIDGDGWVGSTKKHPNIIEYATTSQKILHQVKLIMLRNNIVPEVYKMPSQSHSYNGRIISSKQDCYKLIISGTQSYKFLDTPPKSKTYQTKWVDENYAYLPVRQVQEIFYDGTVYNLEVEDDNSYVSIAGALHNCLQRIWFRCTEEDGKLKLNMNTHWRSRDAYKAAFWNMFALTELQKRIAQQVSETSGEEIELGAYVDFSNSFHIYEHDFEDVERRLHKLVNERRLSERTMKTEDYLKYLQKIENLM